MQSPSNQWSIYQFRVLVLLMIIVGATQGFVSPFLSTVLERQHVSPSVNGISAAMLYAGMFFSMFFCSKLLKYIGFRKTILTGIVIMISAIVIFPFTHGTWWWSGLRFLLGIGDNITTFAVQLWVALYAKAEENGKRFSQFGLSYGLGLGLGPLGLNLEFIGFWIPFAILTIFLVFFLFFCFFQIQKDIPNSSEDENQNLPMIPPSYKTVYVVGFLAMWSAFIYGFIEVAIAGNFPVYGLKIGLSKVEISLLITVFIWMSLLFQIPLGILGDKIGRHKLLTVLCFIGALGMLIIPIIGNDLVALIFTLGLTGSAVGSMLAMSFAFLSDLLPVSMLARGNLLATSNFAVGSMIGPYIGGLLMQHTLIASLFYFLSISLFSFVFFSVLATLSKKGKKAINDINMH
ncbi:MFS transporter [Shimazuella kribbensis]|uniref:MFS transporter n=1 Tax=Shimazuella kribbensis TaxID=139808 RepID=UPI00041D5901|nr:MFS transporter [Shimazuella kribbensis]